MQTLLGPAPRVLKFKFAAAHLTLAEPPPFVSDYRPRVVIELSGRGNGITVPTQMEIDQVTRCLQHPHPASWIRNTPIHNCTGTRPETRTALNGVYAEDMMWRNEYSGEWSGADDSEDDGPIASTVASATLGGAEQVQEIDPLAIDRPHVVGYTNGDFTHIDPGDPNVPPL
jgi:hypothetical protein